MMFDGAQIGLYRLLDSVVCLVLFVAPASQWIDLSIIDRETDSKTAHMNSGQMGMFLTLVATWETTGCLPALPYTTPATPREK